MTKLIFLLASALLAQTPDGPAEPILHWNDVATQLQEKGRFREAREAYQRAIKATETSSVLPVTRLRLQLNLASLYLEERAYAEVDELIQTAESQAHGISADNPELARLFNVAGTLRLIQGNLSSAEQSYEKALVILDHARAEHSAKHGNELASVLLNIASVRMRQGRYPEARSNLERGITLLEESAEAPKSHLIRALASRSTLEYLAKDWTAAERAAARALAMAETHYGPESPLVGEILQNYSLILDRLRRGKEARSYRTRARALLSNRRPAVNSLIDITELSVSDRPAVHTK